MSLDVECAPDPTPPPALVRTDLLAQSAMAPPDTEGILRGHQR